MQVNWTALAVLVGSSVVAAAVAYPQQMRADEMKKLRTACWNGDVRRDATAMALNSLREALKDSDPRWTDDELKKVRLNLNVAHLRAVDVDARHISCGGSLDLEVSTPDGRTLRSAGTVLDYEVFAGPADDWSITMQPGLALNSATRALKESPAAQKQ